MRLSADHAYFFRWLFPRAKFLFLTRNPYHAFRSYCTISNRRSVRWFERWPDRPVTPELFGRHWERLTRSYLEHAEALGAEFLRYEDIAIPDADLSEIECYLGVTLADEARASNPGGFPLPDDRLAEREYDQLAPQVEPLAESLGYVREGKVAQAKAPPHLGSDEATEIQSLFRDGLSVHQSGDLDAAEKTYCQVLQRDANHAGAWHFLGIVHLARGERIAAREHIERALSLCDTKAVYWNNYGAVLKESGQLREAEAALHRALDLRRDYADAWTNLGHVQQSLRLTPKQVERSYRNALKLAPKHVDATFHLADFYQSTGRHPEAAELYRRGLELSPEQPRGTERLVDALLSAKMWRDAEQLLRHAIDRDSDNPQYHFAMARAQAGLEDFDGAKQAYRRIISLGVRSPIWKWKHLGICPPVFPNDEAVEEYWDRLRAETAESRQEEVSLDWRTLPWDGYTPSFNLPHHGRCCREVREGIAARFESAFPSPRFKPRRGGPIRVGFLITAGHELGFLRGMSRVVAGFGADFEATVFCASRAVNRCRAAIGRDDVRYVTFPRRFDEAVDAVRAAQCDVAYHWKVGPDPWSYFFAMARLAPVQCTSSGCHGTSGVKAVDYYLSSPWMESPDERVDAAAHYTENLALFETFPMFQSRQRCPENVSRSEFRLPGRGAIYFCPHRLPKYCPSFDFYLRDLLESDPTGHVLLLTGSNDHAREMLQGRMRQNMGHRLFNRVRFQPAMPVTKYYRLFRLATLVLDTPVYASSLTAYDAFSVGVPVLTQSGPLAVQNYATGLYRCMEMSQDLVASGRENFVAKAVAIGTNPEHREHLVRKLAQRGRAVFDDARVIGQYERFFSKVLV